MPRIGEFNDAEIADSNFKPPPNFRPAVQVSLGCHVDGVAQPHVDPGDSLTVKAGVYKRALCKPPVPNQRILQELREFTRKFVRSKFTKLSFDSDVSVEGWLPKTNYPETRKQELRRIYEESKGLLRNKDKLVKSFVKAETYPEYKHARLINSRSDLFKCLVGPVFRLIEEVVFKSEEFIKKIPVADRPRYIIEKLERLGAKYGSADFVSYESHFVRQAMEAVEFELYDFMTEDLPCHDEFMRLCRDVLAGVNVCQHKFFTLYVIAKRMSGEMNTSLGNGIANLIILKFLYSRLGEEAPCVVEGDDSLVSFIHQHPSVDDYKDVGFTIKMEVFSEIEDASFCGLIFDRKDLINITDPLDVLSSFGWASRFYTKCRRSRLLDLLRCKALSYLHQYPGCPIVQSLSLYALRCTRGRDVANFIKNNRGISGWERDQLLSLIEETRIKRLPIREVPINTRLLMERKFGVPIHQQIEIERYLDGLNRLQVLSGPLLEINFGVFHDYFSRYTKEVSPHDSDFDFPNEPWVKQSGFVPEFLSGGN